MNADPGETARTLAGTTGGSNTPDYTRLQPLSVRIAEAARICGVSQSTIDRWRRKGILPSTRIGSVRLFRVEDLARLLDEHAERGEEGAI